MSEPTKMALMIPNLLMEGGRQAGGPKGLLPVPDPPKRVTPWSESELMEAQGSNLVAFMRPWESITESHANQTDEEKRAHWGRVRGMFGNPALADYGLPMPGKRRGKK